MEDNPLGRTEVKRRLLNKKYKRARKSWLTTRGADLHGQSSGQGGDESSTETEGAKDLNWQRERGPGSVVIESRQ